MKGPEKVGVQKQPLEGGRKADSSTPTRSPAKRGKVHRAKRKPKTTGTDTVLRYALADVPETAPPSSFGSAVEALLPSRLGIPLELLDSLTEHDAPGLDQTHKAFLTQLCPWRVRRFCGYGESALNRA